MLDYDLFARFDLTEEEADELVIRFASMGSMPAKVLRHIEDIKASREKGSFDWDKYRFGQDIHIQKTGFMIDIIKGHETKGWDVYENDRMISGGHASRKEACYWAEAFFRNHPIFKEIVNGKI